MKKTLAALLGLALALTLTACGGNEEPQEVPQEDTEQVTQPVEDPALTAARQEMADMGAQCAVGYLGNLSQNGTAEELLEASGSLTDYPFLAEAPVVTHAGAQVFFLIPRSADTIVKVEEYICDESNGYQGETGTVLLGSQTGQPVIVVCNENDVLPNLQVTLTEADGTELVYQPVLELCGGTVFVPAGMVIQDVSNYETISRQAVPSVDFSGTWEAYEDFDGSQVVLKMTLGEDGSVRYLSGYAYSEFLSDYQGTWYVLTESGQYPAGSVLLEMKDAMSGADFFGVYSVTPESGTITLTNLNGDSLLYGWEGKGITFSPATN